MRCDEIKADLSALIDGELALEARAAVEAHVAACRECARLLADLERVRIAVDAQLGGASAGRADAVMHAIGQGAPRRGRVLAWAGSRWARVAAAVVVAGALAAVIVLRREQPSPVGSVVDTARDLLDSMKLACVEAGRGMSAAPETVAVEARSVWLAFLDDSPPRRISDAVGQSGQAVPRGIARVSSALGSFLDAMPSPAAGGKDDR